MEYGNIVKATFISRPNRFIANVMLDGAIATVHVKNTGRCKELLIPGVTVYLEKSDNPARKTAYDLISVEKNGNIINMDSQAPNHVFYEWAKKHYPGAVINREYTYKDSRFDRMIQQDEKIMFAEVKGVTLEEGEVAMFPDAPTQRGLKHINGLIDAVESGYGAMIFFVVQMDYATKFTPNVSAQPEFAAALRLAKKKGVLIMAYNCYTGTDFIRVKEPVDIIF